MHYVIGDIHCQIDALERLLKKLDLKPEDEVYFVGDWFDRSYTRNDYINTLKWMLDNLKPDSRFKSVCGNHDLSKYREILYERNNQDTDDEVDGYAIKLLEYVFGRDTELSMLHSKILKVIENMPIYYNFKVNNKEYIVTHSWLIDKNEKPLGAAEFDIDNLSRDSCVWDRLYSTELFEHDVEIPTVIHGHTPTLGMHDFVKCGVKPLARIQYVSDKNINIDCCAFRSPMLGGNLAAYRCEDGAEFYAYDDNDFYKLVDLWDRNADRRNRRFNKYEYMFIILFYKKYMDAIYRTKENELEFDNEEAKTAYIKMKKTYGSTQEDIERIEAYNRIDNLKRIVVDTISNCWVELRESV